MGRPGLEVHRGRAAMEGRRGALLARLVAGCTSMNCSYMCDYRCAQHDCGSTAGHDFTTQRARCGGHSYCLVHLPY
jgi:hypothetical protein